MNKQMEVVEATINVILNMRSEMDADDWNVLVANMADAFAPIVEGFDRDEFYKMCLFVDEDDTLADFIDDETDSPIYPICR